MDKKVQRQAKEWWQRNHDPNPPIEINVHWMFICVYWDGFVQYCPITRNVEM